MPIEIETVPCLNDNYAFVVHDNESGDTAVIDVPDHAPILETLDTRGWLLTDVWITHHHADHIDGLSDLLDECGSSPNVIAAKDDMHRLPTDLITQEISEGDSLFFAGQPVQIFDVSGHTVGHIAFYLAAAKAAFTADSLMALGCGRLFEGAPSVMWDSLKKLRALPADTMIYSGHEYTAANAKFALTIEPNNPELILRVQAVTNARAQNQPTVPSSLAEEMATNPFLRADVTELQTAVGMLGTEPADVFKTIRLAKDNF